MGQSKNEKVHQSYENNQLNYKDIQQEQDIKQSTQVELNGIEFDGVRQTKTPKSFEQREIESSSQLQTERLHQNTPIHQSERDEPNEPQASKNKELKDLERQSPILDLSYEKPPKSLQARYVVADNGQYLSADNHQTVLFEDKGNVLKTAKSDRQTVQDMLEVAKAKGWDSIKLSGSPEFKSMMYVMAESQGIKTSGYKPTPADLKMVEKLREDRSLNGIQSNHKPDISETLSTAEKLRNQSATPDVAQINSSPIADTEKSPKISILGNKTIPSEVLRNTQEMTTAALTPEVANAKAAYDQKAQQLSEPNQARLKAYERNTMDVLRDIHGDARHHALRNYYEFTTNAMNGTELNLPQPMQQRERELSQSQNHNQHRDNHQDFEIER